MAAGLNASGSSSAGKSPPAYRATAKEKVYAYLESRPAGADANEIIGLLLSGAGSDPDLGARLVRTLLAEDPNFLFDAETGLWSLRKSFGLRVPLEEARFTVVDLETTGGRAGPGTIIEIGAWNGGSPAGGIISEPGAAASRDSPLYHRSHFDQQ